MQSKVLLSRTKKWSQERVKRIQVCLHCMLIEYFRSAASRQVRCRTVHGHPMLFGSVRDTRADALTIQGPSCPSNFLPSFIFEYELVWTVYIQRDRCTTGAERKLELWQVLATYTHWFHMYAPSCVNRAQVTKLSCFSFVSRTVKPQNGSTALQ